MAKKLEISDWKKQQCSLLDSFLTRRWDNATPRRAVRGTNSATHDFVRKD
jgi:hypothetical protein